MRGARLNPSSPGYTLVEVLLALLLVAVGVLAAAPMFMYAAQGNASGADLSQGGAVVLEQLETLRKTPFGTLTDGGSLDADVAGYFDDSHPVFTTRWRISSAAAPPGAKTIQVRAVPKGNGGGPARQVTLATVRCR